MARDFLCIQPSTVALERAWSICRHTCSYERSNFKVGTIHDRFTIHLHYQQQYWAKGQSLLDEGDEDDLQAALQERVQDLRNALSFNYMIGREDPKILGLLDSSSAAQGQFSSPFQRINTGAIQEASELSSSNVFGYASSLHETQGTRSHITVSRSNITVGTPSSYASNSQQPSSPHIESLLSLSDEEDDISRDESPSKRPRLNRTGHHEGITRQQRASQPFSRLSQRNPSYH